MERRKQRFSLRRSRPRSRSESPSRAPPPLLAGLFPFWRRSHRQSPAEDPDTLAPGFGDWPLPPLMEGPDAGGPESGGDGRREGWSHRVWGQISRNPSPGRSDARLLLDIMAAPLGPVAVSTADAFRRLSVKDTPIETSSAQYILQQYTGATGGLKLLSSIRNSYAMGKVKMVALEIGTVTKIVRNDHALRDAESGGFILWQMSPNMWNIELAVGNSKVCAGCNGELIWRHTPWLGAHPAEGPVRPLRRALQGLDPLTIASLFANAQCIGEKAVNGEDCFVLKICADSQTLQARSEPPVEVMRHFLHGYFSMKTGFLMHMEDSYLTQVQSSADGDSVYWETTISSFLDDYRPVDGIMIAHSGRSVFTLYVFGDTAMSHTMIRMEEVWSIEEVAFNVHGLSADIFIPPAELPQGKKGRISMGGSFRK